MTAISISPDHRRRASPSTVASMITERCPPIAAYRYFVEGGMEAAGAVVEVMVMTARRPCPPAPGPLEAYTAVFDDLFGHRAQRRGFRA